MAKAKLTPLLFHALKVVVYNRTFAHYSDTTW